MKARSCFFFLILLALPSLLSAQGTDTSIVFQPANPDMIRRSSYSPPTDAWGFDVMISNNGFGAGGFYRHEFSDDLSGIAMLGISDVKDDGEVEYFDYWGNSIIPGKKNRLLMFPLMFGVQYRLFREDIMDNFRPYISGGLGPTMMLVAPYAYYRTVVGPNGETLTFTEDVEFFKSLKYGQAKYTVGGFVAAGAYFGAPNGTLMGLSIRYYFVPFPQGIEILNDVRVKNFGGFYITLNVGSFY
jgi:hypothetical protein